MLTGIAVESKFKFRTSHHISLLIILTLSLLYCNRVEYRVLIKKQYFCRLKSGT